MATPIPHNAAPFTLHEILDAVGGRLIGAADPALAIAGVSTDTRGVQAGQALVALRGDSYDAHDHLAEAAARGATLAIVERDVTPAPGLTIVRVDSTLAALGALARSHTRRWRAIGDTRLVIAVTGSAGKTTTRVALTALLVAIAPGEVLATRGNLNNLVGLPMTLLSLEPKHRYAIVELGTNHPGEIARLAEIAEPDAGIVTLVAAAHLEGLGDLAAVAREKGSLYRALVPTGTAIGNGDDARVVDALSRARAQRRVTYGTGEGLDYRVVRREIDGLRHARVWVERNAPPGPASSPTITFRTPLLGEAGALAAAAAIATVEHTLGHTVSAQLMTEAMESAEVGGGAGRLVPRSLGDGIVVLDDSYNANPASMCASIRAAFEIARAEERRLVLVLGEMRELGGATVAGHDEVARAAIASGAGLVIAVAGAAERIHDALEVAGVRSHFATDSAAASSLATDLITHGDLVLVKGSHGVHTERVIDALVSAHGEIKAEDLA